MASTPPAGKGWGCVIANPKKLRISKADFGLSQLIFASTFSGSTDTPKADNTCPKNFTSLSQNSHLLNLAYN